MGRRAELAALEGAIVDARHGLPSVVLVAGDAGIGKTTLVSVALGFFQMGVAIGLAIGPALGGILLEWASWRSVYIVRIPVAFVVLVLVVRLVPAPERGGRHRFRNSNEPLDMPGALLVGAGLAAGLLALSRVGASGWGSPVVLIGFSAAAGLLAAWVWVERRSSDPVIDLSLLRNVPLTVANVLNVVANATMFAVWLLAPYYLVTVRGMSTIAGGLMLGIAPLATAVAAPIAGRALGKVSTGRLSSVGLALEAVGLVAVAFTNADTPLLAVAAAFALVGVGLGLFAVPNLIFVMGSIPRDRQGVAGALSQMTRTVGVVAGVASATLFFDARRRTHAANLAVASADPAAFVAAYRDTFAAVGVLCASAIVVSLTRRGRKRALSP